MLIPGRPLILSAAGVAVAGVVASIFPELTPIWIGAVALLLLLIPPLLLYDRLQRRQLEGER